MIRPPRRSPLFPSPPLSRSATTKRSYAPRPRLSKRCRKGTARSWCSSRFRQHFPLIRSVASLGAVRWRRSEEHTSELQSPCNLVCRLLLEKKKKDKIPYSPMLLKDAFIVLPTPIFSQLSLMLQVCKQILQFMFS